MLKIRRSIKFTKFVFRVARDARKNWNVRKEVFPTERRLARFARSLDTTTSAINADLLKP